MQVCMPMTAINEMFGSKTAKNPKFLHVFEKQAQNLNMVSKTQDLGIKPKLWKRCFCFSVFKFGLVDPKMLFLL